MIKSKITTISILLSFIVITLTLNLVTFKNASAATQKVEPISSKSISLPLMTLIEDTGYVPGEAKQTLNGDKVARWLNPQPALSQTIHNKLPLLKGQLNQTQVSFRVVGTVRYKGNGHQIFVTTVQPSSAASAQNFYLGEQAITLKNGESAWYSGNLPTIPVANQLILKRDNFFIIVASDLVLEQLKTLDLTITLD